MGDKKVREKIEARNALENYVYSMKNTLSDGEKGVADKIGDEDKEAVEKAIEEANEWLDDNQDAEKRTSRRSSRRCRTCAHPSSPRCTASRVARRAAAAISVPTTTSTATTSSSLAQSAFREAPTPGICTMHRAEMTACEGCRG